MYLFFQKRTGQILEHKICVKNQLKFLKKIKFLKKNKFKKKIKFLKISTKSFFNHEVDRRSTEKTSTRVTYFKKN